MSKRKKEIRKQFREAVYGRDDYTCLVCGLIGIEEILDAHHITPREDMPNGGYVASNGITVCKRCHLKVEEYLIGLRFEEQYSPKTLYQLIGSTKEQAERDSMDVLGRSK